jgi:2-keto-4-pentenoate hydratase/2-oxohepta-3-ene-1,7-dioic acid hydratase in catechol pathway
MTQRAPYGLVTYLRSGVPRTGLLIDDGVTDLADVTDQPSYADMMSLLRRWREARERIEATASRGGSLDAIPIGKVQLLAPLPLPRTIYCAGANYADHVAEMARVANIEVPPNPRLNGGHPWHFIKSSNTVTGPGHDIVLPPASSKVDWEAELAVVIGVQAKDVAAESALEVIAGYAIGNDLSARDLSRRNEYPATSPFRYDWVSHKNFDGACPLGPMLVPAWLIADPQDLAIELTINGAVKQSSNTSEMIFSIAEQISFLSKRMTLWPGDVILSGCPAGVGSARGEFLKGGDVVTITIHGIGALTNRMR